MNTFILIVFLANSNSHSSGAASVSQEFNSYETCMHAGKAITDDAVRRNNFVLTWGCFKK